MKFLTDDHIFNDDGPLMTVFHKDTAIFSVIAYFLLKVLPFKESEKRKRTIAI